MDALYDSRMQCWSIMTTLTVRNYLDLVRSAHADRGGLSGQREVLKTTTAKRIRERMIADIRAGTVLPAVVIGAVLGKAVVQAFSPKDLVVGDLIKSEAFSDLAIIDGMQRTAALQEASENDNLVFDRFVRVEFWLAPDVSTMVYRMLVLNTGQVPWTLNRQLAVVYSSLLKEIKQNVPEIEKIFSPDKPGRRVNPGQFASESLIELYMGFSLRKTAVDPKEALSEEFARIDFVDNLSDVSFQGHFYSALAILTKLDKAFSQYDNSSGERFSKGRNIFDAQPARVGLVVAIAQYVLGRPGLDQPPDQREKRMSQVADYAEVLVKKLSSMTESDVGAFLRLDILSEVLSRRVGQVGRYERQIFFEAFKVLVEERFDIPNMEPCWRAA